MPTQKQNIQILIGCILLFLIAACSPTRRLKEGDRLLTKVDIHEGKTNIDKSEITNYIKQKPNRKILGVVRFHLWLYNLANEEKVRKKKELWIQKRETENIKRAEKGKKLKNTDKQLFGEWLMSVGEAPVVYDSVATKKSSKQISLFLQTKGYFNNTVRDTTILKKKKAKVTYIIKGGQPYIVNKVFYSIDDTDINEFLMRDTANCVIKPKKNYDVDILQKERERIAAKLNNIGYFYFTKEYVVFKVDSNLNNHQLNITISIKPFAKASAEKKDSIIQTPHTKYYLNNFYIDTEYDSRGRTRTVKDTLLFQDYHILYNQKLLFKPKIIAGSIFMKKGDLYQSKESEASYKRLSELRAFRFVNISFSPTPSQFNLLDCYIQLNPVMKQSFTIESEGTNRGGNLGISGSFVYQNKNTFKGAELLEVRLRGGLEVQQLLTDNTTNTSNINIGQGIPFNTIEFGPEINLFVPRFLTPFNLETSKSAAPKTIFNVTVNYQRRPDFSRVINKIGLSYSWKESPEKRHTITPIELSVVKVTLTSDFEKIINQTNNILIRNSYQDHFTTSTNYTFIYNDQSIGKRKNNHYLRFNLDLSGNFLRGLYNLTNQPKNKNGSFEILDIPFSQYVRSDFDYRYYKFLGDYHQFVFRAAAGIGKPLDNLGVLPFERSFFAGGANGIRAWQIRSLGPGAYPSGFSFDRIGDMQLEGNAEYRFKLLKQLNGAVFIDAGNIWLLHKDAVYTDAEFKVDKFVQEFAIGSGIGARLDFSFFIIRFDLGVKLRDPQFNGTDRWVIQYFFDDKWNANYRNLGRGDYPFLNFNLGIGYPF